LKDENFCHLACKNGTEDVQELCKLLLFTYKAMDILKEEQDDTKHILITSKSESETTTTNKGNFMQMYIDPSSQKTLKIYLSVKVPVLSIFSNFFYRCVIFSGKYHFSVN